MIERTIEFYGTPITGWDSSAPVPGRLIVIEGPDGVGRSTQIRLLKEWLEDHGYGVVDTGQARSALAGPGIQRAKQGHSLDPITVSLFYATDFCDRLERIILPSLRAGMVVLADRYTFSMIARAGARGVPVDWLQSVYGYAPVPDRVIYMDVDIEYLLPRILSRGAFDYWESGLDFLRIQDTHQSFIEYQAEMLAQFRDLADRYDFARIDARGDIGDTFGMILSEVKKGIDGMA